MAIPLLFASVRPEEVEAELAAGDVDAAAASAALHVAVAAAVVAASPRDREYRQLHAIAELEMGKVALTRGDRDGALPWVEPAATALGQLAEAQPTVVILAVQHADALVQLGRARSDRSRFAEAVAALEPFERRGRLSPWQARVLVEARRLSR